jgi:hypothetical protein
VSHTEVVRRFPSYRVLLLVPAPAHEVLAEISKSLHGEAAKGGWPSQAFYGTVEGAGFEIFPGTLNPHYEGRGMTQTVARGVCIETEDYTMISVVVSPPYPLTGVCAIALGVLLYLTLQVPTPHMVSLWCTALVSIVALIGLLHILRAHAVVHFLRSAIQHLSSSPGAVA